MKRDNEQKSVDELLSQAIGAEPVRFDAEQWKQKYPQEVRLLAGRSETLNPEPTVPNNLWRTIMKSRITKLAAAAVIIIAVLLSVTVWNTSAYALAQTIKAYEGLRYVHIKNFMDGETVPREFWVELDEQEQVKRFRVSIPVWAEREGPIVAVWNDGELQMRKDNVNRSKNADSLGLEILNIIKSCDPRTIVKELQQLEIEGKVEITTSEPPSKSEPIIITAKLLPPSNDTGEMVLFVDQDTKLVTRIILNKHENGDQQTWEFSDYNIAVDESIFILNDVSNNTAVAFMKNINTKLAMLDINKSMVADIIAVLGEPWVYKYRGKDLEKDNLPEAYKMVYPGNFIVNIYKNQIMQWGCQQIPGHEISGYVFPGSIQIGTTIDDIFKKLGSPEKVIEGFGPDDNKIMYEDNTGYANMNINDRKGFCFSRYGNNGEEIKLYLDDHILYNNLGKTKGFCSYGIVSNGKRARFEFMDNKVIAIYEYRTEPIENAN